MIEPEWVACEDPHELRRVLGTSASERKLRLFASACCRRIASHFKDERSCRFMEASDQFADKLIDMEELESAFHKACDAQEAIHYEGGGAVDQASAEAVLGLRGDVDLSIVFEGIAEVVGALAKEEVWDRLYAPGRHWSESQAEGHEVADKGWRKEAIAIATLFRDIFGNPFRPVTFSPEWRTDTALSLARQMYDSREFGAIPILADALQDAGCEDEQILSHCRGDGPHVRGCWVCDLVLGKE